MKNFIFLIFSLYLNSQTYVLPKYQLLDKFENSDLNYKLIDSIDSQEKGVGMLKSVFNVVSGNFTIYRFMTHDKGILFDNKESDLNNIIVLKISSKNIIVDGYQYFLQNPEMPSKCFLYKVSNEISLKPKLKINNLKFKKVGNFEDNNDVCKEIPLFIKDNNFLYFNEK